MSRPSWDDWALGIARAVATRGDCTRRQVGVVILDSANRIVSCGYNGAPSGDAGCLTSGACPRGRLTYDQYPGITASYDNCIAVHGEANALLHGDWRDFQGATLYCTAQPCPPCWKLIAGAGIKRVVWLDEYGQTTSTNALGDVA